MYPNFKYTAVSQLEFRIFSSYWKHIGSATWRCKDVITDFRSHKVNAERQDRVLIATRSRRHRRVAAAARCCCDRCCCWCVVKCYDSKSVCFSVFFFNLLISKAAQQRVCSVFSSVPRHILTIAWRLLISSLAYKQLKWSCSVWD